MSTMKHNVYDYLSDGAYSLHSNDFQGKYAVFVMIIKSKGPTVLFNPINFGGLAI